MPNRNYERGVRLEREILNKFKSLGWEGARTAGSHSGADVILWGPWARYAAAAWKVPFREQGFIFEETSDGYILVRERARTRDVLFIWTILVPMGYGALFIQCKRKKA